MSRGQLHAHARSSGTEFHESVNTRAHFVKPKTKNKKKNSERRNDTKGETIRARRGPGGKGGRGKGGYEKGEDGYAEEVEMMAKVKVKKN